MRYKSWNPFPAHRQVLGTRSPYFDDALQSGFKEGITHEISFEKDSPHALWRALQESSAIGHGRLYMTRSRSLFATPAEKARKILDKAISVLKRRATYFEGEKLIKESELGRKQQCLEKELIMRKRDSVAFCCFCGNEREFRYEENSNVEYPSGHEHNPQIRLGIYSLQERYRNARAYLCVSELG